MMYDLHQFNTNRRNQNDSILKYTFVKSYKSFVIIVLSVCLVALVSITLAVALNRSEKKGKYIHIKCVLV